MTRPRPDKVSVIGLWHLGLVSAAGLADLGYTVTGWDSDTQRIENLKKGKPPLYEPGLEELVKTHLVTKQLQFESSCQNAVSEAGTVLITYDTPVDKQDRIDLTLLRSAIDSITPFLLPDALILVQSQIPVGTCEEWQESIRRHRPDAAIDVVYSPENLRLGRALELFKRPDMIVIGSDSERAREKAEKFYAPFSAEKIYVSCRTAEMAKHALNSFFATSISFANELGHLCDAVGADGFQIAQILRKDGRIGAKAQVRPGLGFAGATLARDLRGLQNLGKKWDVPTILVDSVLKINERQIERIVTLLETWFEDGLRHKTLTLFGLTYKAGTSTLRRSASLEIIDRLHAKGALLRAHDPKADVSECSEGRFDFYRDPYEACQGSSGIVLLTEWPEYRDLDYGRIKKQMTQSLIFDAKNFLDGGRLRQLGFTVLELGRGQLAMVKR